MVRAAYIWAPSRCGAFARSWRASFPGLVLSRRTFDSLRWESILTRHFFAIASPKRVGRCVSGFGKRGADFRRALVGRNVGATFMDIRMIQLDARGVKTYTDGCKDVNPLYLREQRCNVSLNASAHLNVNPMYCNVHSYLYCKYCSII